MISVSGEVRASITTVVGSPVSSFPPSTSAMIVDPDSLPPPVEVEMMSLPDPLSDPEVESLPERDDDPDVLLSGSGTGGPSGS